MFFLTTPASAEEIVMEAGSDWCGAVNAAAPGDVVVLASGVHAGPCVIRNSGTDGAPITLAGENPSQPTEIRYEGTTSNVIDVQADHVSITFLAFGPTAPDIDAIKIKSGSHVLIEGNTFQGVGGISVSANSADSTGITVRHNAFRDLDATGIYLGCHEGSAACVAADVVVEANLIDGVRSPDVGYGLEIKKDSWGLVRDNVVHDTQGPGIEIFGAEDPQSHTTVDGNLVARARNNASLEVGGPNVDVDNNVVIGGGGGALLVYAYWDTVHDVRVRGNTVVGEGASAVSIDGGITTSSFINNAVSHTDGSAALPGSLSGVDAAGNVDCTDAEACWQAPADWDFLPTADGPLTRAGTTTNGPATDFCGRSRPDAPTAGALEAGDGPGPLSVAFKDTFLCDSSEATDDSGTGGPNACGCTSRSPVGGAALFLAFAAATRRRRIGPAVRG